ncbi:MAG: hypothetical protein IPG71_06190 [bacterium]|nr:hypothetical protein [bacterium]
MNMKNMVLVLVLIVAVAATAAPQRPGLVDLSKKAPVAGRSNEDVSNVGAVHHRAPSNGSLDVIGTQYEAGTTWYDYQHNGTAGKMIGVDDLGFVHVAWMNGQDEASVERHAFYNCWDPTTQDWQELIPEGGVPIDNAPRAGYVTNAVTPFGFAFPAYHATPTGGSALNSIVAIDFQAAAGAFTPYNPEHTVADQVLWPKIVVDEDSTLHGISTSDPDTDQGYYYWRGTPSYQVNDGITYGLGITFTTFNTGDQVMLMGNGEVIAPDVATSPVSDRVAIAFNDSRGGAAGIGQINNDLKVAISEDGGLNWAPPFNLTDWIASDLDCASGDTIACNGDTLRPYTDMSLLFDYNDHLHVAFTTRTLFEYGYYGSTTIPDTIAFINLSSIWHWSEHTDEFSCVTSYDSIVFYADGDSVYGDNAWQLMVQRPSLAIDTATDWMYCTYVKHDSDQVSSNLWMSADAFVAGSCNLGRTWYNSINLTSTVTPNFAPAGECMHERDVTLAKLVTYDGSAGYLHVQYEVDHDVGGVPQSEGVATQNPMYYLRVPLADLDFVGEGMRDWLSRRCTLTAVSTPVRAMFRLIRKILV